MYCEKKQIRMCTKCKLSGDHYHHDCNLVEKNEDEERSMLTDLKSEVSPHSFISQFGMVFKKMESK